MRLASYVRLVFRPVCPTRHSPSAIRTPRLHQLERRVAPAVFTVNADTDTGTGTGNVGDLRFCLTAADINGEDDTINIEFSSAKSIFLNTELTINEAKTLTITVPVGKAAATVDGQSNTRLFSINTASLVTIANLTLTKGLAPAGLDGGAINVAATYGNLTVQNCTISNSKTFSSATGESGGAIALAAKGNLVISNSTITGNIANKGAGVYFFSGGSAVIDGCTFTKNTQQTSPTGGGGAIYFFGVPQAPGFVISNSTIHGNTAGDATLGLGGAIRLRQVVGTFTIRNSTITGNTAGKLGGGIYVTSKDAGSGVIEIISSIFAENTNSSAPDISSGSTLTVVRLNNSALGSTAGFILDTPNSKNNLIGIDFKLGPLAINGGPTETRLPLPGSPLREKGSNPAPVLSTDQRGAGFPRLLGTAVDIGAVESIDPSPVGTLNAMNAISVPGPAPDVVTVTYTDGQSGINHMTIGPGDIEVIQVKTGNKLMVSKGVPDVAMNGSPRQGIYTFMPPGGTWDAGDNGVYEVVLLPNQVFDTDVPTPLSATSGVIGTFRVEIPVTYLVDILIDEDDMNTGKGDLSLREALKLANADAGSADIITFDPMVFAGQQTILLTLGQLNVTDNVSIVGPAGRVTLDAQSNSRVLNIFVSPVPGPTPPGGRPVHLSNLVIQNGKVTGEVGGADNFTERGGGVFINFDDVSMTNCSVLNNTAQANGGGVFHRGAPGKLTITNSEFKGNSTTSISEKNRTGSGGGIAIDIGGELVLARSTVSGNSASRRGGGIYFFTDGSLEMANSTVSGNSAQGANGGGGLYFFGSVTKSLAVVNSTFSGNKAPNGPGGGIALKTLGGASTLTVSNSSIVFNEASFGGGISRDGGSATMPIRLDSSIVAKNIVTSGLGTDIIVDATAADIPGNNNLIGVADDGSFFLSGVDNQTGSQAMPLDPLLDASLSNNGGPTQTHKLLTGSPAIDEGSNPGLLTADQRGSPYVRVFNGKADVGAFEFQIVPPPCVVGNAITINGGAVQRSRVTEIRIDFDQTVTLPALPETAFELKRQSDNALVTLTVVVVNDTATHVTLTFSGAVTDFASLKDGRYTLTIDASKVSNANGQLDGDCNGTGGDNFVLVGSPANGLFRLFGDADGNGTVNTVDFNAFRSAFGGSNPIFDFDNAGGVSTLDFNQFRTRFGSSV